MACVQRSENDLGESVLSSHSVSLGDQIQTIGLGSRHFFLLSRLSGLWLFSQAGLARHTQDSGTPTSR